MVPMKEEEKVRLAFRKPSIISTMVIQWGFDQGTLNQEQFIELSALTQDSSSTPLPKARRIAPQPTLKKQTSKAGGTFCRVK